MSLYTINSGEIKPGWLYQVFGESHVVYNLNTYYTGQIFTGVSGITTYYYSGSGTKLLYELTQFFGSNVEYLLNSVEQLAFPEITLFSGFTVEYELIEPEKIAQELTTMHGFTIEFLDNLYSFVIIEHRL